MYDSSITIRKGIEQLLYIAASGAITAALNYVSTLDTTGKGTVFLLIAALLRMTQNYLKHKDDD